MFKNVLLVVLLVSAGAANAVTPTPCGDKEKAVKEARVNVTAECKAAKAEDQEKCVRLGMAVYEGLFTNYCGSAK